MAFKKTMADLDNEIQRILVERCKLDACMDVFLIDLMEILQSSTWVIPANLRAAPVSDAGKRDGLIERLEENINRLLPGLVRPDTDIFAHESVHKALRKRWYIVCGRSRTHGGEHHQRDVASAAFDKHLAELNGRQSQRLADATRHSRPREVAATPSLTSTTLKEIYRDIKDSIESEAASASFVCGGSIPTENVNIFWATSEDSMARKLALPLNQQSPEACMEALQQLVKDCSPASFGRGQQDIIDPEYRRAGKLDSSQFASNFELSHHQIIPYVEAVLLPAIQSQNQDQNNLEFRHLTAELYKLNIYSGPSGLFQKHVDTPRAQNQIGSLVVCFPSPFKGGDLVVRHGQKEVKFNWSTQSDRTIQWAAFYSDCEHEIKQITEGERITLTYNLYVTESKRVGGSIIPSPVVDPKSLPLYSTIKGLLQQPAFMVQGGILGIYLSHGYPHTSSTSEKLFPRALKGSDLTLYSILQSIGVDTELRPILQPLDADEDYYEYKGESESEKHQAYLRYGTGFEPEYDEPRGVDMDETDIEKRWKILLVLRQPLGLDQTQDFARKNGLLVPEELGIKHSVDRVGDKFHSYRATDRGGEDEGAQELVDDTWPHQRVSGITWINEPGHEEMAFTYMTYGNEASLDTIYSHAAILAAIPPFEQRKEILES